VAFEAVHLDQHLVQRLLALVVATAEAGTAMAADRIDFVDEDDARRVLLGVLEHVANAGRADADEHFDEVGTGNAEERHLGFAGDRLREQGLAGTRDCRPSARPWDAAAELLELRGIAQEIDNFLDLFLGLVATGDVGEGNRRSVASSSQSRPRLAERESTALAAALHLAHEENPDADQQQHREPADEDVHQEGRFFFRLGLDLDAVFQQIGDQPEIGRRIGCDALAFGGRRLQRAPLHDSPS
jgi:hypothetical protein